MHFNDPLRHAACGAAGGFVGTIPMTILMRSAERKLPPDEQYALPPKRIATHLADAAGVEDDPAHVKELDPEWDAKTYAGHFAYGTTTGAAFGAMWSVAPSPPSVAVGIGTGIAYGLGVWAASYLGWLPAVGLHPPATREPASRNALMIAAHVVWGATLGAITAGLARATDGEDGRSADSPVAAARRRRYARPVDPDRGGEN
jgi:uncharacterized membrane protein YagU involved in acid resistance